MAFYPPATCSPAWSVDKFAQVPSAPLPPSSVTPPQLPNLLSHSSQPSTPSSHTLPPMPALPSSNAAAAAPATEQPWAQPTISTFSTSASLHIVQPYLRNEGDSANSVNQSGLLLSGMSSQSANRPRRPANAWILYRSDKMKILKPTEPSAPRRTQADISKLIAEMWRNETEEIKRYYETLSDLAKAEHHAQYPTYRFQPAKKTEKPRGQKKARKAELRAERGVNAHCVVSSTFAPLQGRSANSQPEQHSMDDALSSQRSLCSHKTVPALPSAPLFVPYEVPPRPRSSGMRETQRPTRLQPSAEPHGLRPTLSPLVTTFSASSMASSMPGESASSASSEAATRFAPHWLEQSTTFTQYPAHSDRSHAYNPPVTVCLLYSTATTGSPLIDPHLQTNHEQPSAAPTVWTPSTTSYEYPLDPAQSAGLGFIHTEPQPLSRISSDPYINLFTHPGASVEVELPVDFNYAEMGGFDGFEQWFGPGGLDIAGYPTFSDPTSFQQPPHRLPHHTAGEHQFIKQESSALHQSSGKRGVLAYPTPPPCSPPTTPMPPSVPYGFPQVAAPTKSEHPGLYSSPPPATCHYVGQQQGWGSYQPLAPA